MPDPIAPAPVAPAPDPTPAPSPTPSPAPAGYVEQDGRFSDGWLDRLPAEFETDKTSVGRYKTLPEFIKGYRNLEQTLGRKAGTVEIPKPDSPPEVHAAYRKALGIPETADAYKFMPEKLPDGMEIAPETVQAFGAIAHKHGIPQSAMQELTQAYLANEAARGDVMGQAAVAELEKGRKSLEDEWKGNYQANLGKAAHVAKIVGLDPESPGLRDPNVIKALSNMAGLISEDKAVIGNPAATSQPGVARAKAIMRGDDPSVKHLHDKYMEGDEEVVNQVRAMLKHG